MVHDLNPKNLHINGSMDYFFAKSQNPCFLGVLGYYPQNEIFSKKSGSVSFLPLRHPNFMGSFREILRAVLKKTRLPTDILTYWQWWNHRTPFRLKAKVQRLTNKRKTCLFISQIYLFKMMFKRILLKRTKTSIKYSEGRDCQILISAEAGR